MALADARAMIPALGVADDDPAADATLVEAVADWAERYTPLVALDRSAARGCFSTSPAAPIFSEANRSSPTIASPASRARGFRPRGDRRHARRGRRSGPLRIRFDLRGAARRRCRRAEALPLAALRLAPETVAALDRVGLKRIGQIVGAPRAPLAARFGRDAGPAPRSGARASTRRRSARAGRRPSCSPSAASPSPSGWRRMSPPRSLRSPPRSARPWRPTASAPA